MTDETLINNPFKVLTPEAMSARDAVDLFVEVSEFRKVQDQGNTMLNGPRGSGKSMLLRYLMADCQVLAKDVALAHLPFFSVLVSIKNTAPYVTELRRPKFAAARMILNEHVLTIFVASKVLKCVLDVLPVENRRSDLEGVPALYDALIEGFRRAGGVTIEKDLAGMSSEDVLEECIALCDGAYVDVNAYIKRTSIGTSVEPYTGPLCDFTTFLLPILELLPKMSFLPNATVYLLLDDADHLSVDQTKVLNSWLTVRGQGTVSIKLSTQYDYKTYSTQWGGKIRSPHDFQEINMADVYTSKHGTYVENVRDIVTKRLRKAGIMAKAATFFPPDEGQESAIQRIAGELKQRWPKEGRGYRASDDVIRYARPEFIRGLGGPSKSTSTYSYAGFAQLVHISSGQVRYFLEAAADMYDEESARTDDPVEAIRPRTQNDTVRKVAEDLMFNEFDNLAREAEGNGGLDAHQTRIRRLRNLIQVLGYLFFRKLVSDDSERRVFSIAVSGSPDLDVQEILDVGVRYGYFHRSSIGNKEGTGRTQLYVLTRRVAPHFGLDPSSFSGYQFVTNGYLRWAMERPSAVLAAIKREGPGIVEDDSQLELF